MKNIKIIGIFIGLGLFACSVHLEGAQVRSRLIVKYAQCQPSEPTFKELYGPQRGFGGELSVGISTFVDFWIGGMYCNYKSDPALMTTGPAVQLIPIETGLKLKFPIKIFTPYVGGGLVYTQYIQNKGADELRASGLGYCGQAGLVFPSCSGAACSTSLFVIDIFVNYSVCRIETEDINLNTGGLKLGIGWGLSF